MKNGETQEIYRSKTGIVFEYSHWGNVGKVEIINDNYLERDSIASYFFPYREQPFVSPYLSWANLNVCNGWSFYDDLDHLENAVQRGEKLVASAISADKKTIEDIPLHCSVYRYIDALGKESMTIYRNGSLTQFFNISEIIKVYREWYKIPISEQDARTLYFYGDLEIDFFVKSYPYDFYNPKSTVECIVTGLLLGYPIESTVSFMSGHLYSDNK